MANKPKVKWTPDPAMVKIADHLERRITAAAMVVEARAINLVNRGQPVARGASRTAMSKNRKTMSDVKVRKAGALRGLDPSKPGEPPKVLTGRLKKSITHVVSRRGRYKIQARVGTNVKYARRLEFGFVGVDKKGRNYNQAPRPFMRPAFVQSRDEIRRILTS